MVRESGQRKHVASDSLLRIYVGQTRAKKVSDLREYDVIITTHAVRPFYNPFVTDSEPID
jgi:hypothetical protein